MIPAGRRYGCTSLAGIPGIQLETGKSCGTWSTSAELLASLDGPADPDAAISWDREITRRVDALEAGTEKLESWESVKRRIARDTLGQ